MSSLSDNFSRIESKSILEKDTSIAFFLYLLYLVSFFLHLPSRVAILGTVRFDFVLVGLIFSLIISSGVARKNRMDDASKYLFAILIYSVLSIPLVEWPGSVINNGVIEFIKAAIFYFFTVGLVVSEGRLKLVVVVFVICNLIRVLEPLCLHIIYGYLGSVTHLGGGEFAGRLSGAPSDVVNPNGLAFIIATIFPFLHYVFSPTSKKALLLYIMLVPVLIYTMGLTLSRSGVLALGIIGVGIWLKSTKKFRLLIFGLIGFILVITNLNEIQKDRYLSIVSDDARQSATADGRI
ncbi:hypothetical protein, partial [Methylophaga sp.]|uniref:hypothetical protein n=1 Tax=Methylophaga sp. TaxID=2024840 RepID=UPI003A8F3651